MPVTLYQLAALWQVVNSSAVTWLTVTPDPPRSYVVCHSKSQGHDCHFPHVGHDITQALAPVLTLIVRIYNSTKILSLTNIHWVNRDVGSAHRFLYSSCF